MNPIAAAAGLTAGFNRFDSASRTLSSAFQPRSTADPAAAVADQAMAAEQVQACVATMRVSDRMLGQLLDIIV